MKKEESTPHSMRNNAFVSPFKVQKQSRHWSWKGPGRGKKPAVIQPTAARWAELERA